MMAPTEASYAFIGSLLPPRCGPGQQWLRQQLPHPGFRRRGVAVRAPVEQKQAASTDSWGSFAAPSSFSIHFSGTWCDTIHPSGATH